MSKKLTLKLSDEMSDLILKDNLAWHYEQLKRDLKVVKDTGCGLAFYMDPDKDAKEIKKYIKAFALVCDYMGCSDE